MQNDFTFATEFCTPNETAAFASALAPLLQPGDTLLLEGPIGAGKSHFFRSLVQSRLATQNLSEDVPSPTFTLVQTYDDTLCEIWHSDLYRLSDVNEVDDLGLWDAFETAICLIEWPDRLGRFAPGDALWLTLTPGDNDQHRLANFHSSDPKWRTYFAAMGH